MGHNTFRFPCFDAAPDDDGDDCVCCSLSTNVNSEFGTLLFSLAFPFPFHFETRE